MTMTNTTEVETMTTIDISEMGEGEIKAAIRSFNPIVPTPDDYVETALLHVRQYHPTCVKVLFDNTGRWRYMDANNEGFSFGGDIDVDLLEIASDTLNELPILFEMKPDSGSGLRA